MEIRCCSFSNMAAEIKKHRQRIVLFGAGVIGTVTVPEILSDYGLLPYVDCYIDNDNKKWGTEIEMAGEYIRVCPPQYLKEHGENRAILLNMSRYVMGVLKQLEELDRFGSQVCYIMPVMCIYNYHNGRSQGVMRDSYTPLIPKTIHYVWFGGRKMPENLQKCIDSWKKYCPDYEIVRWDETNYDINKNLYMKQAYENQAYALVSDYARLDILYHFGGVYMDTDVELIRPLDELLYQEAFCGVEKWQVLNSGGCSGAVRNQEAIRKMLEYRENICFINENGEKNTITSGFYETKPMLDNGYRMNGQNQKVLGMNIYAYDYFHPYDYLSGRMDVTDNTFSIHHFNGGWLDEKMKQMNERTAEKFNEICGNMRFDDTEGENYRWMKKF